MTSTARLAHRVAWEAEFGPIPAGMVVRHSCDNPGCVNVAHLSLGTHADNVADRVARGRSASGSRNGRAKLSEADVRAIRLRHDEGAGLRTLGKEFGVSPRAISWIVKGVKWRNVA